MRCIIGQPSDGDIMLLSDEEDPWVWWRSSDIAADSQPVGGLLARQPASDRSVPSRPAAADPCGGAAHGCPLRDKLLLKLGQRGETVEAQAAGAGGVDPLVQGGERHPAPGQRVDGLHRVPQRPAQPVQPPHHQRVPGPQVPRLPTLYVAWDVVR